jgi:S-adenosylmethionine-diacylglycerol 3-amino-3-carboxypropyl transferase
MSGNLEGNIVIDTTQAMKRSTGEMVGAAVHRNSVLSAEGLAERAFTLAFSSLVYPQIWEDPVVDMEAMALEPTSRIVTIASGGCNVMSYLTASPEHITAVDLNTAHIALNRLKLAAARHLDTHHAFHRFFATTDRPENVIAFDRQIAPYLDSETLDYWQQRDWRGRRRIAKFGGNFYRTGLLGRFIAAGHLLARVHGKDATSLAKATTLEEQREIFERELAPLFAARSVRWLIARPASLFGLGIPPAQYKALAGDSEAGIGGVLHERLERLACGFPMRENYFARQAFGRSYGDPGSGSLPPYLEAENFETLRANVSRVSVRHVNFTEHLAQSPDASLDRYVLLDAQDWMSDVDLTRLWQEITRTARPGARVIFRTAAEPSLLPGRLPDDLLARWTYHAEQSRQLTLKDRSAIYGGFHLYELAGPAS